MESDVIFPVHELRPADIKVVAAVGDSLTVSGSLILHVPHREIETDHL